MTANKKTKTSTSVLPKKAQFSLAAREDHADYSVLLEAKELFARLVQNTKLSRAALLLKLVRSFALTGNFTLPEKQLVTAAANHEGISIEEFSRRATLLYAGRILSKKNIHNDDGHGNESNSVDEEASNSEAADREFIAKPKSQADLKVEQIVNEMMRANKSAASWQDKKEITARSVNDWGKHTNSSVEYKSINQLVLKRYFMLHRAEIKQHHVLHNIKPDHNRRAVATKNKELRQTSQDQESIK